MIKPIKVSTNLFIRISFGGSVMFKATICSFLLMIILVSTKAWAAPEAYVIDPTHTYPNFAVSHLGFSTMYGRFDKTTGEFSIDREAKKGSVEISIDTAT